MKISAERVHLARFLCFFFFYYFGGGWFVQEKRRTSQGVQRERSGVGGGLGEVRARARSSSDGGEEKADHKYARLRPAGS